MCSISLRVTAARVIAIGLGIIALGCSLPARAQTFYQTNTGMPSPVPVIRFDEIPLPVNTPVLDTYASLGIKFSPGVMYDPQSFSAPHMSAPMVGNFIAGHPATPVFSIFFTTDQTNASFVLITNAGTTTFEALRDGTVLTTANATTNTTQDTNIFGFNGSLFDEIRIHAGGFNNAALLDNVKLHTAPSTVPEPGTMALLASGALPLLRTMRRRRRG